MAKKSQTKPDTEASDPLSAISALQQSGLGNIMGLSTAWAEALSDMNAEFIGFLADRIKEDAKTQNMILNCRDASELQRIQAEFIQKAIRQYQAETGKLMEISSAAFSNFMKGAKGA